MTTSTVLPSTYWACTAESATESRCLAGPRRALGHLAALLLIGIAPGWGGSAKGDPVVTGNLPPSAELDRSEGREYGTPEPDDIERSPDVTFTVTDGESEPEPPPFDAGIPPAGTTATTLTWLAPIENEDGSALLDLAGFRIYYGASPSRLESFIEIDNPGLSAYTVDGLLPGSWFFAMTAVNSSGIESVPSNIVERRL